MAFFDAEAEIDIVYADALIVGESPLAGRTFMEATPSTGGVTLESLLSARCTIILSGVLARRRSIIQAGMFDECFRHSEDFDLWLRMAKAGSRIAYQRKVLLIRTEDGCGLSANTTLLFESALAVLEKARREYGFTRSELAALDRHRERLEAYIRLERGKRDLSLGRFTSAAAAFREANQFYRSWKLRLVLLSLRISPRLLVLIQSVLRSLTPVSKRAARVYE
jgi:GT2 family glycosyltransferase